VSYLIDASVDDNQNLAMHSFIGDVYLVDAH
jgi:hypothetical protein